MTELSLNILDISQNSVKAGADTINITLTETEETLEFVIKDNGCGMDEETVNSVTNPFYTTRTTRNVGLGVPLLKLAAEQTGGDIEINSVTKEQDPLIHGTELKALFYKNHIDFTPLGDIISSVVTMIQGAPDIRWSFVHTAPGKEVTLFTDELKAVLGDIPLDNAEVITWIKEYLKESYSN
ncbi:MAG: sensor histidine kinase [Clostridiales bacterium]|nr:sensor histidine kinase [Clostridiales bacterium]